MSESSKNLSGAIRTNTIIFNTDHIRRNFLKTKATNEVIEEMRGAEGFAERLKKVSEEGGVSEEEMLEAVKQGIAEIIELTFVLNDEAASIVDNTSTDLIDYPKLRRTKYAVGFFDAHSGRGHLINDYLNTLNGVYSSYRSRPSNRHVGTCLSVFLAQARGFSNLINARVYREDECNVIVFSPNLLSVARLENPQMAYTTNTAMAATSPESNY